MTADAIKIVKESFAQIDGRRTVLAEQHYANLFSHFPLSRALFPRDLTTQLHKLENMFKFIVDGLDDWPQTIHQLEALGRAHREFGIRPFYYEEFNSALLKTLREILGDRFTCEVEAAWKGLLTTIARVMIDAQEFGSWTTGPTHSNPFSPIMGVSVERYAVIVKNLGEVNTHTVSEERLAELGLDSQTWETVRMGWNARLTDPTVGGIVAKAYIAAARQY